MRLLLLATAVLFLSGCVSRSERVLAPEKELPCWMTEESAETEMALALDNTNNPL